MFKFFFCSPKPSIQTMIENELKKLFNIIHSLQAILILWYNIEKDLNNLFEVNFISSQASGLTGLPVPRYRVLPIHSS